MITKLHILIIDDNEEEALLLLPHLRQGGIEPEYQIIETLAQLATALDKSVWDIVLSDYHMQRFNGLDALKLVRQKDPHLPFILISGSIGEKLAIEAMHQGANDYLIKSDLDRFVPAVTRALREAAERRKHKQAQDALQTSETRYRRLFEAAQDGILILDSETGVIVDANQFLIDLLGLSHEQFLNMKIWEIGAFRDIVANHAKFAELKSRGYVRYEGLPLITTDGREINVEFVSNIYQAGPHKVIQCNIRDITEQKRTNEHLRQSEARLSEAQKVAKIGSWETTLSNLKVQWSDEIYRIFEIDQADFQPTHPGFLALVHPEDRSKVDAAFVGSNDGKNLRHAIEHRIVTADGRIKFVEERWQIFNDEEGRPVRAVGSCQDITERKKTDMALRETLDMQSVLNAMLQRSLANVPLREKLNSHLVGLFALPWLAIQPKGAIFLMSPMGNALVLMTHHGLAPALLTACANVPLGRCLCGKAAQICRFMESIKVGEEHHITYEGMMPHGHYCAPIIASDKTLGVLNLYLKEGVLFTDSQRHFIKSVTDILAESILRSQTEDKLFQSQKMDSVGRLAGGVAHDFNNILTAISGYAGFLMKELADDDPKRNDVKEILNAAKRAAGLTRQLLAFSRKQMLNPQVIDLNSSVNDTVKMVGRLIGESIRIEIKLAAQPCHTKVDPGQIDQVLVNLAVNARDAMPMGGTLTLETELIPPKDDFFMKHPDLIRGPVVCLSIRDTGSGMTAEVKKHLFEPFFTSKEKGKGTGLGLSTVFGIVKQSGGDIEVESELNCGTTFRIYFSYIETTNKDKDKDKDKDTLLRGTETVLLVEDEESLRRLGERLLRMSGYTVIPAADGKSALEAAERHGKPVDLLMTDIVMPYMNGRELATELARRKLVRRTLFMSGYTEDAIVEHGVLKPGIAFIYKPFTIEALSIKLREVLDGPADKARA
ncbi:MAG TPA: hypothetical protein DCL44_03865 [Elusimicrobia bacterium]|nr:hypothetical protein [Elusimicrobiota bacterium]